MDNQNGSRQPFAPITPPAAGAMACKRAFDIALDSKKTTWSYIRAILRDKLSSGVRCLAHWDALEEKRAAGKKPTSESMADDAWRYV